MHIHTIAAFALLFWRMEVPSDVHLLAPHQRAATAGLALGFPALLCCLGAVGVRKTRSMIGAGRNPAAAGRLYHRLMSTLRLALLAGFGASVLLTPWPDWFALGRVAPALQIFGDMVVLGPYFAGAIALWCVGYPVERQFHGAETTAAGTAWSFSSYLDFYIRHHLLVISGPMLLILFAANLTHGYEEPLQQWSGSYWMPDILLGAAAGGVFLLAPFLLRRLWRTSPLGAGPLRSRLTRLCDRVGLRCREILVWKSDGLMINAAVMGIVPAARYVLLSDALLATMTPQQIEAVFGHEAGHVRHRHMQHFLLFALVGWLVAGASMEWFTAWFRHSGRLSEMTLLGIQGASLTLTLLFWIVGFGWLSRRFERQADLFGARCVTPLPEDCHLPCSVHLPGRPSTDPDRVCATGAAIFASALDRVATVSGIGHDEPSWRHSSVGNRIRFLYSAAGDPARAIAFERVVRRVKAVTLALALAGSAGSVIYWNWVRPVHLRPPNTEQRVVRTHGVVHENRWDHVRDTQ